MPFSTAVHQSELLFEMNMRYGPSPFAGADAPPAVGVGVVVLDGASDSPPPQPPSSQSVEAAIIPRARCASQFSVTGVVSRSWLLD